MRVLIIATGGTFDRKYDPLYKKEGEALIFSKTYISEMLRRARVLVPTRILSPLTSLKTSPHITKKDREQIASVCKKATEKCIVITHGTDTIIETARYLEERAPDKTIVLTGAMIPYSMKNSDAFFNFGCAVTAAQILPAGAYIAMNGKIFPCSRVRKNFKRGIFEDFEEK